MDNEKLNELIEWLSETAKHVAQIELPALAQEIVLAGRIEYTLLAGCLFIVSLITFRLAYGCSKIDIKVGDGFPKLGGTVIVSVIGAAILIPMSIALRDAIYAWFAPRVYLL